MNEPIELFEAVLKGSLSTADRDAFEARVRSDAAFAGAFEEFRATVAIVEGAGEQRLKEKLRTIHGDVLGAAPTEQRGRVILISRWGLAVAASLLLVIGSTYVLLQLNDASMPELYAAHMTAYAAPGIVRGEEAAKGSWSRFGDAYATGRYNDAHQLLGIVTVDEAPAYVTSFYRGQCELLRDGGDPRAAITSFDDVLRTDNDMHALAHWYTALAALRIDDPSIARTHLQALVAGDGYKHDEALELLHVLP